MSKGRSILFVFFSYFTVQYSYFTVILGESRSAELEYRTCWLVTRQPARALKNAIALSSETHSLPPS